MIGERCFDNMCGYLWQYHLRDERLAHATGAEVKHLHAPRGGGVQPVPPVFWASPVPEGDALDDPLLGEVHQVALFHVNEGNNTGLVGQRDHLQHLLEPRVPHGQLVDEGAVLHAVDVKVGFLFVCIVANQLVFVGCHHDLRTTYCYNLEHFDDVPTLMNVTNGNSNSHCLVPSGTDLEQQLSHFRQVWTFPENLDTQSPDSLPLLPFLLTTTQRDWFL